MKVVIADDSSLTLDWLAEMLGNIAHVELIGKCKNGVDTLAILQSSKPDLAIVDFRMPGLSGIDVLREIRKTDTSLKYILLTFYAFDNYRQMAMEAGADYFFSKVDDFEKLSELVAELVAKSENDHLVHLDKPPTYPVCDSG
jgi:DNA-binding NarL/FixJ family response regulator